MPEAVNSNNTVASQIHPSSSCVACPRDLSEVLYAHKVVLDYVMGSEEELMLKFPKFLVKSQSKKEKTMSASSLHGKLAVRGLREGLFSSQMSQVMNRRLLIMQRYIESLLAKKMSDQAKPGDAGKSAGLLNI